jgi:hypothetical protein
MSTFAFKAILIREIEQAMKRIETGHVTDAMDVYFQEGQLDAYAHMLTLISDMEDQ